MLLQPNTKNGKSKKTHPLQTKLGSCFQDGLSPAAIGCLALNKLIIGFYYSHKFDNDEEFIENYLIEKKKEEDAEKKRREKDEMVKKMKKGVQAKFQKLLKKGTYAG